MPRLRHDAEGQKHWKKAKERRPEIREVLPGRLAALAAAGERTGKAAGKKHKD